MRPTLGLPVARFLDTLEIVAKEGKHLSYSWSSLFNQTIDIEWVVGLEQNRKKIPGHDNPICNLAKAQGIQITERKKKVQTCV